MTTFKKDLKQGDRYCFDYVYGKFMGEYHGVHIDKIDHHETKELQKKGENAIGLEVKSDSKLSRTGNLFIEVGLLPPETDVTTIRMSAVLRLMKHDGIYRADNTRYYAQGDKNELFVFKIERLRNVAPMFADMYSLGGRGKRVVGFCMSREIARSECSAHFNFKDMKMLAAEYDWFEYVEKVKRGTFYIPENQGKNNDIN